MSLESVRTIAWFADNFEGDEGVHLPRDANAMCSAMNVIFTRARLAVEEGCIAIIDNALIQSERGTCGFGTAAPLQANPQSADPLPKVAGNQNFRESPLQGEDVTVCVSVACAERYDWHLGQRSCSSDGAGVSCGADVSRVCLASKR